MFLLNFYRIQINTQFTSDHIVVPPPKKQGVKCLVLDLDETLVHSSFQPVEN